MRPTLLRHLACPDCASRLTLEPPRPQGQWIEEGQLHCAGCGTAYPIRRGVPRFPLGGERDFVRPTAQTRRTYDFTWRRVGEREIARGWEKDSYRYSALIPPALMRGAGKLGLEAGCGGGADLRRVARGGAELIGVDLSEGAEAAARACRDLPNVHVVQTDIYRLPFRPGAFDFIYSFGVLHHLPDPALGFRRLSQVLKPGGPFITYLYEDFSDRSAVERALLQAIRVIRTVTSRLPARMLYALCWLATPLVWFGCSLPAALLRQAAPRLAERIPFRHTLRWPVLASDLFDRFAPPVEQRYGQDGVRALYQQAGCDGVEIRRYRGWVSWGFRASVQRSGAVAAPQATRPLVIATEG